MKAPDAKAPDARLPGWSVAALFAFAILLLPGVTAVDAGPAPQSTPWEQEVRYRIEAVLDEDTDVLAGQARIRYTNRSPDTLRTVYVHQYLNAFRPNSAWARSDLEHGDRTFQDLGTDEHAFERIRRAAVDGRTVEPFYPHAPDSTIAGFRLPEPLAPGDSLALDIRWDARLSTEPRRQARRGRDFDFAQWYPRVVVYDLEGWRDHPLYRQGEFYGEFATYDVTLEVSEDQVLGATGVPLEGDPGWERVAAPGTGAVDHRRDWYGAPDGPPCVEDDDGRACGIPGPPGDGPARAESLGHLGSAPASGNRRVRWYAEDVHHFAWSTSPEYIYEEGSYEDVVIRVLYRPDDEESWGGGVAVDRTATALAWMDSIFGDYAYPQVTNLHRIEPGGTEFPMVIMDGSASLSLILHEVAHLYAHAILGNNEWYEGWLDEGMATFVTSWFFERRGQGRDVWLGAEAGLLDLELRGHGWPVTYPAEDYPEYGVYAAMIYTKGSFVFRMLRDLAGEERMVELLRAYYQRHRLGHVDGDAFQRVAEDVLRRDLDWFFGQWLHGTGQVDYALDDVTVEETARGRYRVDFAVEKEGELVMPVPVRILGDGGQSRDTTVSGTAARSTASVETGFEPTRIEVDPNGTILDWNGLNDVWTDGILERGDAERRLDRPFRREPAFRDRLAVGLLPLFWANDAGGAVLGVQRRANYLGSLHRSLLRVGLPGFEALDRGGASEMRDPGSVYYRIEDPIVLDEPRFGTAAEAFLGEGRLFSRLDREWDLSALPQSGPRRTAGAYLLAADVYDPAYLVPGRWSTEEGTLLEAGLGYRHVRPEDVGRVTLELSGGGGISTRSESWVRGSLALEWDAVDADGWGHRARLFAGGSRGDGPDAPEFARGVPPERRFGVAGAGPYRTLSDPWGRSRGALLEREAHRTGEGNLRGFRRDLMADRIVSLGSELRTARFRVGPLALDAAAFLEGGWIPELASVESGAVGGTDPDDLVVRIQTDALLADAGMGVMVGWAEAPLALRVDVPFFVSDPVYARSARSEELGFRWAISVVSR